MINFRWSIVPIAMLLIGLNACSKDTPEPESTFDEARLEELAGKFNQNMAEEDFNELYELVREKTDEAYGNLPQVQADVSNREYLLTYSDQVRLEVGGAVYFEDRGEVAGGTTVNGVVLPPELFEQLDASAAHQIRLQIRNPFDWTHYVFGLRQVVMTVTDQGNQVYYGLYNVNSKEYLFLGIAGASGNIGSLACGAIGLGRVYGKLANPYATLTNGEVSNGIIAGCFPVLVGGSVTFYYTGTELP